MRPFRSPAVLRLVAVLLMGGVGATLAPSAVARDARAASLRALLDDAAAFETALAASRAPEAAADPVGAFADAYVEAAGGGLTAEFVRDLLDGQSFGLVAPVVPEAAFAPTPVSTTHGSGMGVAVLPATVAAGIGLSVSGRASEDVAVCSRPEAASSRPRAP